MAWYYSVNGKAEGPVTQEFLLEGLRSGRLTLVDLAFKEGGQAWATLGEFAEFQNAFSSNPLPAPESPHPRQVDSSRPSQQNPSKASQQHSSWEYAPAWVLLKPKDKGFEQVGPFSEAQILEMIGSGEVSYSQYVWRPGYKRWVRIGNLPEFDRRKRDREGDSVNQIIPLPDTDSHFPVLTREELLGAIERLHRKPAFGSESPPEDAASDDLVEADADRGPRSNSAMEVTRVTSFNIPVHTPAEVASTTVTSDSDSDDERTRVAAATQLVSTESSEAELPSVKRVAERPLPKANKRLFAARFPMRTLVAVASSLLLVIGVMNLYSRKTSSSLEAASSESSAGETAPALRAVIEPVSAKAPKAVSEMSQPTVVKRETPSNPAPNPSVVGPAPTPMPPSKQSPPVAQAPQNLPMPQADFIERPSGAPATVVEIVPLRMSTRPSLAFQSDIGVGEAIKVILEARTGDILQYPSFYAEYEVRRSRGEIGTLDLTALKIPRGTYRVRAIAGVALDEAVIFVGVRDAEFARAREKHLKEIAVQQQAEKKAMYYGAVKLESLAKNLNDSYAKLRRDPKRWGAFLTGWRKQAKEASAPVLTLVYRAKPQTLAFRRELEEFQKATQRLAEYSKVLDVSVAQKRDVAGSDTDEVGKEFSRLKTVASRLTGR